MRLRVPRVYGFSLPVVSGYADGELRGLSSSSQTLPRFTNVYTPKSFAICREQNRGKDAKIKVAWSQGVLGVTARRSLATRTMQRGEGNPSLMDRLE